MSSIALSPPPDAECAPPVASMLLRRLLPGLERTAALALSVAAGYLHLFLYLQHYPLGRDEVNSLNLATLPTFTDTWKSLSFDSCPLLFHTLVRAWVAMVPTDADSQLRLLGLLIGLGGIVVFWVCARTLGSRVPLLSLVFLAFNPLFIRYDDSVHAEGLGVSLALLTFLAIWRVVESARPSRVLLAGLVAVLSVQVVFNNAVLLFAVCVGGVLVAARERDWKKAALVASIGSAAAVSLLPYGPMIHEQHRLSFLMHPPATTAQVWKNFLDVTGSPDPVGTWVWVLLLVGVAALVGRRILRKREPSPTVGWDDRATLFTLSTLLVGTITQGLLLGTRDYSAQPWNYLAALGLTAVCLDALCGRLIESAGAKADRWRLARLAFVLGFTALTFLQARQDLVMRPTNLDLVAAELASSAGPDDLIVHTHWECAVTFNHYYHGSTRQETLPPITDHRVLRYDLVLERMTKPDAISPVLNRLTTTLRAGHKVWLVGKPIFLPPGKAPRILKPVYEGPNGWRVDGDPHSYYNMWIMEVSGLLRQATRMDIVWVANDEPVTDSENLPVRVFQGWKPETPDGSLGAPSASLQAR